MDGQISNEIKSKRSREMIEATLKSEADCIGSLVGKTVEVLFETEENGKWTGYTKNYAHVEVTSSDDLGGKLRNVKILSSVGETALGELV